MDTVLPNEGGGHVVKCYRSHLFNIFKPSYFGVCTYGERQLVAPDNPDAGDTAAVVFAKQDDTSKGIFSEFLQALEHAWNSTESLGNK